MGKLRRLFESLVYAGMKPPRPGGEPAKPKSAWRQRLDQFVNGSANTDPLYLSNRTIWQQIRAVAIMVVPFLLLGAVLALAWSGLFKGKDAPKPRELTVAERAARVLPNFDAKIQLPANHDLDVQDAHVEHGSPTRVVGRVKNNTDHVIASAELVFDLADRHWSRLGAVNTRVGELLPHSTTAFRFAVAQDTAEHVLVREYQVR
ncbi:MAG: FxLYD domain-containing protein [Bryobacteraceae bacterium]